MRHAPHRLDVLSGLLALPLAWLVFAGKAPRLFIRLWNCFGLGLLINIVTVAMLSMPTPFRQFSPANLFVAEAPFIWLPALLVTSALFGHLLVFRKLHSEKIRNSRFLSGTNTFFKTPPPAGNAVTGLSSAVRTRSLRSRLVCSRQGCLMTLMTRPARPLLRARLSTATQPRTE